MQHYPGRDALADVLNGAITLRKFRVMVENLPPGNVLERARADHRWTDSDALLWAIDSRLAILNAQVSNALRRESDPVAEPRFTPRPDEVDERQARDEAAAVERANLTGLRGRLFGSN